MSQGYRSAEPSGQIRSPSRAGNNLDMSKIKTCSRCGLEKPLSAFYKQAGGAQGQRGMCKECFRAAERSAYAREDPKGKSKCRLNAGSAVEVWSYLKRVITTSWLSASSARREYLDPPRRARHVYLANGPSEDGRRVHF